MFVKSGEAECMLRKATLDVLVRRGVSVNPITLGYQLTRHTAVNQMLAARKKNPAAVVAGYGTTEQCLSYSAT